MTRGDELDDRDLPTGEVEPVAGAGAPETPGAAGDDAPGEIHDAVGAYVLDALPDDERAAFEQHLATCAACQQEVRDLRAAVDHLPSVLDLDPAPDLAGTTIAGDLAPSSSLRHRIVGAARAEATALAEPEALPAEPVAPGEVETSAPPLADEPAAAPETAPDDALYDEPVALPPPRGHRPRGRIRAGEARPAPGAAGAWQAVSRLDRGWLAAAVMTVVAVGAILWALALQGQIGDQDAEIDAQRAEIAQLRSQANATAAILGPTQEGPEGARGTLFFSLPQQFGVLVVQGLPDPPPDQVYQLWYVDDGAGPAPGPTFTVGDDGEGFVTVAQDTPTFNALAITAEPEGGSDAPTTPILLQGILGGAAG